MAAVVTTIALGAGARRSVLDQFEAMGTNLGFVDSRAMNRAGRQVFGQPLTDADVAAIRRETTSVSQVLPVHRKQGSVSANGRRLVLDLRGTTPEYPVLFRWSTSSGGQFVQADLERRERVCLLGDDVALALFGDEDALGQNIFVETMPCRVIGVLARRGASLPRPSPRGALPSTRPRARARGRGPSRRRGSERGYDCVNRRRRGSRKRASSY